MYFSRYALQSFGLISFFSTSETSLAFLSNTFQQNSQSSSCSSSKLSSALKLTNSVQSTSLSDILDSSYLDLRTIIDFCTSQTVVGAGLSLLTSWSSLYLAQSVFCSRQCTFVLLIIQSNHQFRNSFSPPPLILRRSSSAQLLMVGFSSLQAARLSLLYLLASILYYLMSRRMVSLRSKSTTNKSLLPLLCSMKQSKGLSVQILLITSKPTITVQLYCTQTIKLSLAIGQSYIAQPDKRWIIMSNFIKQPSIKLIPSDPTTNTILIIYCVSPSGASVPYRATWRKLNPKNNKVEEIRTNNGSSYRCSPLDLDCLIEATVSFQHQNQQLSRTVTSNIVKASRELKDRKVHYRQPILSRLAFQELALDCRLSVNEGAIHLTIASGNLNLSHALMIKDIAIEVEGNQLVFKVLFKENMHFFLEFLGQILGWRPEPSANHIIFTFGSDTNRDIILLGIAEYLRKIETVDNQQNNMNINYGYHKIQQNNGARELDKQGGHSKNKSHTYSPSGTYKQKFKLAGKLVDMKRSFTNGSHQKPLNSGRTDQSNIKIEARTQHRLENKDNIKERQFLNVFQEDQLQLLGPPRPISFEPTPPNNQNNLIRHQPETPSDQPSMNLRGSFQQLEKSFTSNINEDNIDRLFKIQSAPQPIKLHEQLSQLKKQNQQLKKQSESINSLTKQNNLLKRKYHELKEELSRLEMQKKIILTDKLRCEVNWHKEVQEKEQMKKELDYLRDLVKGRDTAQLFVQERTSRTHSIHDVQSFQRKLESRQGNLKARDVNRSPNSSFHR